MLKSFFFRRNCNGFSLIKFIYFHFFTIDVPLTNVKFQHTRTGTFAQDLPVFKNPYTSDTLLKSFLKRHIPEEVTSLSLAKV